MARLKPDTEDQRFLRRLLLVLVAIALAYFLYRIADLLLLAFGAALGAILLSAGADAIAGKTRLPRWAGLVIVTLAMLIVLGAIGWLFGAETGRQASRLFRRLPSDWAALQMRLGGSPLGRMLIDSGKAGAGGGKIAGLLFGAGWKASEIALNFIVILIGAIFFAADPSVYARGILLLSPAPYRAAVAQALDDTAAALRLWLLTQLFSMVAMGLMIAGGLWLSGLEGWAALGVLGGLSEFIPYIGPTLAMIPALIVALAGQGSVWGVIGTYAVVRIVQANIITPLVSQRIVAIPAGLYIFAILAMGFAFGGFGMFFAGALSVAAFTLVRALYLRETLGEFIAHPGD